MCAREICPTLVSFKYHGSMQMIVAHAKWKRLSGLLALLGVLIYPTALLGTPLATAALPPVTTATNGPWSNFSHLDELISPSVLAVQQDSNGYLWVGTTAGVSILSPEKNWVSVTSADGLGSDIVVDIVADPTNAKRHWFATTGGVTLLDDGGQPMNKAAFTWVTFGKPDGLAEYDVSSVTIDADHRVWLGLDRLDDSGNETGFGISILNTNNTPFNKADDAWITYVAGAGGLSNNVVRDTAIGPSGVIWIATQSGLNAFHNDTWTTFYTSNGLPSNDIRALLPVGDLLWVATTSGIAVLKGGATPENKADDQWTTYSTSNSAIAANSTKSLAVDSAGRIWVGTDRLASGGDTGSGVSVLDTLGTPFDRANDNWITFTTTDGLASNAVRAVIAPSNDGAWIGTNRGLSRLMYGSSPFVRDDDDWKTYSGLNHLAGYSVYAAAGAGFAGVWLGTEQGLSFFGYNAGPHQKQDDRWITYSTDDGLPSNSIRALALDGNGRLWIGTAAGLTIRDTRGTPWDKADDSSITYNSGSGLIHNQVNDIVIDAAGQAWIAGGNYFTGGLQVLDIGSALTSRNDDQKASFTTINSGLPDPYVTAVALGGGTTVWVGTQAGAARLDYGSSPFDQSDDQWTAFHPGSSGLAEDKIRDVAVDKAGNVWFALATEGASVYSSGGAWVTFRQADGLASNILAAVLADPSGQIWLGTNGGGVSVLNHNGTLAEKGDDTWITYAGDSTLLSGNVTMLAADRLGQIWVGALGGGAAVYSTVTFTRAYMPLIRK
jgi:ligand-binding sensor domain-containing protein